MKYGKIISFAQWIDKVNDGYTRNGSCIDVIVKGKDKTFSVKDLKDGVYYCPKELWKQNVLALLR